MPAYIGGRAVRPLLSLDHEEARRRVLNLYRVWYRQLPFIIRRFDIPKNYQQVKAKLREEFLKNKDVNDPRSLDMLIIQGHILLKEALEVWMQKSHLMRIFQETVEPGLKTFLDKFRAGLK